MEVFGFLFAGMFNRLAIDWVELAENPDLFYICFLDALVPGIGNQYGVWTGLSPIVERVHCQGLKAVDFF